MNTLSSSLEDYLEAIYEISEKGASVKSIDVATRLKVSRASVNKAVNLLADAAYVLHERYSDICLTEKGKAVAAEVKETHVTLEKFFTELLGVSGEVASAEACRVEHCLSKDTLKRLKNFIASHGVKA